MKYLSLPIFVVMMTVLTGCEAIGDIFSAGFYSGLAVVVVVVVLIIWIAGKRRG